MPPGPAGGGGGPRAVVRAATGAAKRAREQDQAGLQHKWQRKLDAAAGAGPTALAALQQAAQTELDAPRGCAVRCGVTRS